MEEEKKEAGDPSVTPKEEEAKVEKPTLESINSKLDDMIKENERLKKQNSNKDSHISKIENENKTMRDTVQKISTSLEGKSEKQKDAIVDGFRERLLKKGNDPDSVEDILECIVAISDKKANEKIAPIIMESAQELVEADSEIDQEFLEKNSEAITEEYNSFKQEVSPRKIKANLKKAYNLVKERLVEKAKTKKPDSEREDMLPGGSPPPKGAKKPEEAEKDFIDSIANAGTPNSHFI